MSLTASEFQKSPSARVDSRVKDWATRRAWRRLATPSSGSQVRPWSPPGSKRCVSPRPERQSTVARTTSFFTLVTTTGPGQSRMAGTTSEEVLPA